MKVITVQQMSHCHFPLGNQKEITLGGLLVTRNFTPIFLSSVPSQQPSKTSSLAKNQGRDLSPTSQARINPYSTSVPREPRPPAWHGRSTGNVNLHLQEQATGTDRSTERRDCDSAIADASKQQLFRAAALAQPSSSPTLTQAAFWLAVVKSCSGSEGGTQRRAETKLSPPPLMDSALQSDSEHIAPRGVV